MTTLSTEQLRAVVARHFQGDDTIDTITAICLAESGGVVDAVNDNYPVHQPDPDSIYRYDRGLAQINSVHGYDPTMLVTDPDYNLAAAKAIYEAQGFGAWSTYNVGAHLPFMPIPHPVEVTVDVEKLTNTDAVDALIEIVAQKDAAISQQDGRYVALLAGAPAGYKDIVFRVKES